MGRKKVKPSCSIEWSPDHSTVTVSGPDASAVIEMTEEKKRLIVERVLQFFGEHECWSGESVMQCDAPQIDGPEFLADLVDDVLKPKVEWFD